MYWQSTRVRSDRRRSARPRPSRDRRGVIIVLAAFFLVAMLVMVAAAVDVGYIATVRTELKRSADAGALAGANVLVDGTAAASQSVRDFVKLNKVGGVVLADEDMTIETGLWDPDSRSFAAGGETPSAIRVVLRSNDNPFFFGRAAGRQQFDLQTEAIAVYQPRDIQVVLDFSGSMNDDSELKSEGTLGWSTIDSNLLDIYSELGSPTFGNMTWLSSSQWSGKSTSWVKTALGLDGVAYPYPSGSWTEYINYVKKSSSNSLPSSYRHRYGYKTWTNYLLEVRESYAETPSLWQTSEQPVSALKDSFSVFLAFLQEVDTNDRVGLTIYNSSSGTAVVEQSLTYDFGAVETKCDQRQAGHYQAYTNIGDGIKFGRQDLVDNARAGAFKLMVLMTDGLANRPSGVDPTTYAQQQAALCAAAKIPIVTISLGAGADTSLMQNIADTTGGVHFNIPGGQTGSDYQEQLEEVFRQVADDRPLKLVK